MKSKILTGFFTFIGAMALFVCIPAEAPTAIGQLLWSGSWVVVLLLCSKGIERFGNFTEEDDEV